MSDEQVEHHFQFIRQQISALRRATTFLDKTGQPCTTQSTVESHQSTKEGCPVLSGFPLGQSAIGWEAVDAGLEDLQVIYEQMQTNLEAVEVVQEELLQQKQYYQDLFQFFPIASLVTDAYGVIMEANQALAQLLNVSRSYLVGKPLVVFVAQGDRAAFRTHLNQLSQSTGTQIWRMSLCPRDGETVVAELHVAGKYLVKPRLSLRNSAGGSLQPTTRSDLPDGTSGSQPQPPLSHNYGADTHNRPGKEGPGNTWFNATAIARNTNGLTEHLRIGVYNLSQSQETIASVTERTSIAPLQQPRLDVVPTGLPMSQLPQPLDGLQVLVVDDEADIREFLTVVLEAHGIGVRAVASAAAALEALERFRPDVLISDIRMPGENGYNLIRQIRALEAEKGGHLPAAAITAYLDEDREKSLQAGFEAHLYKLVQPSEWVEMVTQLARQVPNPEQDL